MQHYLTVSINNVKNTASKVYQDPYIEMVENFKTTPHITYLDQYFLLYSNHSNASHILKTSTKNMK